MIVSPPKIIEKWRSIAEREWKEKESDFYTEENLYSRRYRRASFFLKIDFETYRLSSSAIQSSLICSCILRSIAHARQMPVRRFDFDAFHKDMVLAMQNHGWITEPPIHK